MRLTFRGPGEPSEEIAPPSGARHPRLLVRRAQSLFRQTNRATCARLGAGIGLVAHGQRFFLIERGRVHIRILAGAEQFFPEPYFHLCLLWLIVRRTRSSNDFSCRPWPSGADPICRAAGGRAAR